MPYRRRARVLNILNVLAPPAKLPPRSRTTYDPCWRRHHQVCLRCCTILSRAFLNHLQALASLPGFGDLWLDTLALLSNNLEDDGADEGRADGRVGGGGGVVAESCQQIVTNMVMVVAYAGLLGGQDSGDTGDERSRLLCCWGWCLVWQLSSIRPGAYSHMVWYGAMYDIMYCA